MGIVILYCSQLIITNFFDDVLDNETFDVIDDEAVNLLALVSDEWILSFSAVVVSDLENDSAIVVEALDLTMIDFSCYFVLKLEIRNIYPQWNM